MTVSWLTRLRTLPIRKPGWVLLCAVLSLLPAGIATKRLDIRSSFAELLPANKPSVLRLKELRARVATTSTLIVVLEGPNAAVLERAIDALTPRIRALGPGLVTGVIAGNRDITRFLSQHRFLYSDLESVREVHDEIVERYDYEVGKRTGLDLGLVDESDIPPPIDVDKLRERFRVEAQNRAARSNDYYIGENGRLGAIVVRTPLEPGSARTFELERAIRAHATDLEKDVRLNFTGSLVTSAEEHRAVVRDLASVGSAGVLMILGIVFLFFLRVRALVAIGLAIGVGVVWSFAFAYLTIGHLNSATGFLVSIIAGDGINFGIILTARYQEARLRDGLSARDALDLATGNTAAGTLTAALSSAASYASLAVTSFRGFRDFGVIAGTGMLICWLATYIVLPALLVTFERVRPLRREVPGKEPERPTGRTWQERVHELFGKPFAFALRFHRPLFWAGILLGVVSSIAAVVGLVRDPLEYNLKKLRQDDQRPTSARALARRVDKIIGRFERDGQALLADRVEDVPLILQTLEARRAAAPPGRPPFERAVTIFDLLPKAQEEKIELARDVLEHLRRAQKFDVVTEQTIRDLEHELGTLTPLHIDDLPSEIAWLFEERNGTRGTLIYLVPATARSINDAHYLIEWADSYRELRLPNGQVVHGTGDPVLYADMLISVRKDAPKALLAAVLVTCVVVLLAFKRKRTGLLAFGSFLLGFSWLLGYLAFRGERLNFLNFVALPISIGVGADYAVNVLQRLELEGSSAIRRVFEETGGAVVVCSCTTLFGYAALTLSENGAVRSFGRAAAVGELAMLVAALLVTPAFREPPQTEAKSRQ